MSILEIEAITLFADKKPLCRDLSLSISRGEVWGILGANGCGKTTLLHALAGLTSPKEGAIYLNGKPILDFSRAAIAQKIGILLQNTQDFFPQTVWDVCASGRYPHACKKHDDVMIQQSLDTMELTDKADVIIQHLSGGERRRLSIATVLTQAPEIYLLDEPTNHLDIHHQIKTLNHFVSLAKNQPAAVMMSLHDINLAARFCEFVVLFLPDGQYVSGPVKELMNTDTLSLVYGHTIEGFSYSDVIWYQPR